MMKRWLSRWLAHPVTRGMGLDDSPTTELRHSIIQEKPFLRKIYDEWYGAIVESLPDIEGAVLELGSGPGFLQDRIPGLITSDILPCSRNSLVLSAFHLPFATDSLRGIVMTDTLHHLPQPRSFFAEARRCLRSRGVVVMIEPWVSPWSTLIYTKLHHEPFHPDATNWEFPSGGPLSSANGALPWILFTRDRTQFEKEFPDLRILNIRPMMPFRYLVSGGISLRSLMPGWTFSVWRALENALQPWMDTYAMFAKIMLVKS
jgi:SAM-dependent methyltransferase